MQYFILFVIIILCLFVLPYLQNKKGFRLSDILFWRIPRPGKDEESGQEEKKQPGTRNGTQKDVVAFIRRLMRFVKKKNIKSVIPGMIRYKNAVANISAILIGPGEVFGIVCEGYGGKVTPDAEAQNWRQELNGEVREFPNPLRTCENLEAILTSTLAEKDIRAKCRVVPVFTTPDVILTPLLQGVYTAESLFYILDDAVWVSEGSLDMDKIEETLNAMVPMDELKAMVREQPAPKAKARS